MRRKSENLKPEQKLRLQMYLKGHPALEIIYEAKQAKKLIPKFLKWIELLKDTPFPRCKLWQTHWNHGRRK